MSTIQRPIRFDRPAGRLWPHSRLCSFLLAILFCCLPSVAQSPAAPADSATGPVGTVSGNVVDPNGDVIPIAQIQLSAVGQPVQKTVSDSSGHFSFSSVPAGSFRLTVNAIGFGTQIRTGVLHPGESFLQPDIALPLGVATTDVHVSMTQQELAQEQIHVEEKQRVLGVIPNFYVSYDHKAVPLTSKQKFELAWKTDLDPITFIAVGIAAGVEQATDEFSGYGQGAKGYAKRYGAGYADGFIGDMIGGAILPSLLKQDPRYFYKGTGTIHARALYAIANAVICKGDNGHWQANYSGIIGGLAAGGISNLYYPPQNRDGASLTFTNAAIGIGTGAVANLFQEFLVRKLTPHTHDQPLQP